MLEFTEQPIVKEIVTPRWMLVTILTHKDGRFRLTKFYRLIQNLCLFLITLYVCVDNKNFSGLHSRIFH